MDTCWKNVRIKECECVANPSFEILLCIYLTKFFFIKKITYKHVIVYTTIIYLRMKCINYMQEPCQKNSLFLSSLGELGPVIISRL